jgi:hypothetical protein
MRKISGLTGAFVLVLVTASCGGTTAPGGGGGGGGGGGNCPANTFCMGSSTFFTAAGSTATTVTIPANTAVTWTNSSGIEHDVVFDDPSTALAVGNGASGDIGLHTSGSHQRQFAVSGSSHPFHCTVHGAPMHGTVTVQ